MDCTAVANHVIDKIPAGMLCIMIGIVLCAGFLYWLHRSKKVPYKVIKTGTNGKTLITADYLKDHCKLVHEELNTTFQEFMEVQKETQKEVKEISQSIAFIQGKLSVRRK